MKRCRETILSAIKGHGHYGILLPALVALALWAGCGGETSTAPSLLADPTAPLSGRLESEHFAFYFAAGDAVSAVQVEALERHYRGFARDFGVSIPWRIRYFKYFSRAHAEYHTDSGEDSFGEGGLFDIHTVRPDNVGMTIHLLAAQMGRPVDFFHVGLETACPGYYTNGHARFGTGRLHEQVGREIAMGRLREPRELLDNEAFDRASIQALAACQAGSFVRYLLDEYGTAPFKRLYGNVDRDDAVDMVEEKFAAAYGLAFERAVEDWEAFIRSQHAIPLTNHLDRR